MKDAWPLYEVFVRARAGLEHKHVGSVHAADPAMALEHARDLYTRLFAPVGDKLPAQKHIVFEPDGALLRIAPRE